MNNVQQQKSHTNQYSKQNMVCTDNISNNRCSSKKRTPLTIGQKCKSNLCTRTGCLWHNDQIRHTIVNSISLVSNDLIKKFNQRITIKLSKMEQINLDKARETVR